MCEPRILLHQYLDTCSLVREQDNKRRSSDQLSVVPTTINTAKSEFPLILLIIINPILLKYTDSKSYSMSIDQFSVINSLKKEKTFN